MPKYLFITILIFLKGLSQLSAHPGGNLIILDNCVLWSYVYPFKDTQHHASVMIWDKKGPVIPLITSQYPGSNFYLYPRIDSVYFLETRYLQDEDESLFRILKGKAGEKPFEIWPWTNNDQVVSSNGFFMPSDNRLIFCRYPNIYELEKNGEVRIHLKFVDDINRIRKLGDGRLLLLSDKKCWLLDSDLNILKEWNNFINENMEDVPMNLNKVFDMDYSEGRLVLAYWGGRSFIILDDTGEQEELLKLQVPYTAHWVGIFRNEIYMFSSVIDPPNPITPKLYLLKNGSIEKIW